MLGGHGQRQIKYDDTSRLDCRCRSHGSEEEYESCGNMQLRQMLELRACEKARGLSEKERRETARKHVGIKQ
jgi:hypothetical protein